MRPLFGLAHLPYLTGAKTRSISAENPTGEKGKGGMAEVRMNWHGDEMGKGWKQRPCISIPKGETVTLADIEGPGMIQHIWITTSVDAYRSCVLRFYWDDEETPSVEVPLGDFFANGHGMRYRVNSLPIAVVPDGGFNCYWPMPFRKRARVTVENQFYKEILLFFYQITYQLVDIPEDAAYFHASFRQAMTTRELPEHTIVDGIKGRGQYVGTFLAWNAFSDGWWGEGEVKFYIDGDDEYPTICGTGTEDYFGGAWCFGSDPQYSTPFLGYPHSHREANRVPKHFLYRWHIMDPICFDRDLRVTVQALGWWPNEKWQPLTDEIASVAYWYQLEPHAPQKPLGSFKERISRIRHT